MLQGPTAGRLLLVPALGGSGVQNRSRNRVGCAARVPGTGSQADTVVRSGYRVLLETLGSHQRLSPRSSSSGHWRGCLEMGSYSNTLVAPARPARSKEKGSLTPSPSLHFAPDVQLARRGKGGSGQPAHHAAPALGDSLLPCRSWYEEPVFFPS